MSRTTHRISCDASVRDGYAGIAAVLEGRDVRVLFLDVAEGWGSAKAERCALEKAMEIARGAGWRNVLFRTDCKAIKVRCKMLEGWHLEYVPRKHNVGAHVCARQALKLWESGRSGEPTITDGVAASAPAVTLTS